MEVPNRDLTRTDFKEDKNTASTIKDTKQTRKPQDALEKKAEKKKWND